MSSTGSVARDGHSALRRLGSSRSTRLIAATLAAGLTVGVVATAGSGSAGAAATTTYSTHATGRFLSGTIAGLNLDSVAGIEGESAANKFGPTVTNKNSLKAELLDKAIEIPLQKGLQLPGLNVLQLGAVGQYASASPTGSALGASGAVSNSGGVGLGGSNGTPASASLDLSGLGGSQLAQLLNVTASLGAVSAGAVQAPASGSRTASKACGNTDSVTVKNSDQAGVYCLAGADVNLTLPILKTVLAQIEAAVDPILTTLGTQLNQIVALLPGSSVSIPTLSSLLAPLSDITVAKGVTLDLVNGKISIDLAKIVDLNDLPVDTSLVPYLIKALSNLPTALSGAVTELGTILTGLLSKVKVTIVGTDVLNLVGDAVATVLSETSTVLTTALAPLTSALNTITTQASAITDLVSKLLDIIVNHRTVSGGVLTETAVLIKIGSGLGLNSALAPIITALGSLLKGGLPTASANAVAAGTAAGKSSVEKAGAAAAAKVKQAAASSKNNGKTGTATLKPATSVKAPVIKAAAVTPAASSVQDVLVSLNLAQASVGPSTPSQATPTPTTTPTTVTPTTGVPTGVPAGSGDTGGSPTLPLVLVLLTLGLAAGGVGFYRFRGQRNH